MSNAESVFDSPSTESGEYEYDDPDEMHRVRRLRQIHDSRERYEEFRLKVQEQADMGLLNQADVRKYTAQLALDYVRQLEPILRRADTGLLDRTIEIDARTVTSPRGNDVTLSPRTVTVGELLDREGVLQVKYNYSYTDADTRSRVTNTETTTITITTAASSRLVRLCDDFLEDVMPSGLTDTDSDKWGIEYE